MDKNNRTLIVVIVLAVLCLVVMIQNLDRTPIQFLFFSITMPLIILIFVLLAAGFILGYSVARVGTKKSKASGAV